MNPGHVLALVGHRAHPWVVVPLRAHVLAREEPRDFVPLLFHVVHVQRLQSERGPLEDLEETAELLTFEH